MASRRWDEKEKRVLNRYTVLHVLPQTLGPAFHGPTRTYYTLMEICNVEKCARSVNVKHVSEYKASGGGIKGSLLLAAVSKALRASR